MNQNIQKFKNSILWEKISYSNFYQRIRFPEHFKEINKEFQFYLSLLGEKNKLIFDIGANTGEKASIFKKLAKKVVCFEPSPNSIRTLKSRFAFSNVIILPIAIGNKKSFDQLYIVDGKETLNSISNKQLTMVIQHAAKGKMINTIDVPTDTLDNAMCNLGTPQYIKIDVEGNEMEVILGLSKPVGLLSFENSTPNFLDEGIASIDHLHRINNGNALFNIHVFGSFIFREFSTSDVVKNYLRNNNYAAAEIYCRSY